MKKTNSFLNKIANLFSDKNSEEKKARNFASDTLQMHINFLVDSFKLLPDYVFIVDKSMKIQWANEQLKKKTPDIVGEFCPVLCSSSEILHLGCHCRKAIDTGLIQKINIYVPESKGIYEDGYFEGTGIPLKNEAGLVIGAMVIIKNISHFVESKAIEFLTAKGKKQFKAETFADNSINNPSDFYFSLLNELNDGLIITDSFNRIKFWNSSAEAMSGINSDDAKEMKLEEIIEDLHHSQIGKGIEKTSPQGIYFIQDDRICFTHSKKELWINGDISYILTEGDNKIGNVISIKNYREHEYLDKLSEENGEILKTLVNCSPAAIIVMDKDGLVKMWNLAAEKMFGWSMSEIEGQMNPIINMENKREYKELFQNVMQGHTIHNLEFIREKKDGSQLYISLSSSPLREPNGEIKGIIEVISDINDRKFSEVALAESEVKYKSFVQNFQGIAYRLLIDRTLIFINGAVETITGYKEDDFKSGNLKWRELIQAQDLFMLTEQDSKIGVLPGFELDIEYRIIRKDGTIRWVHEFLQNITDKFSKVIYIQGTFQDITRRKEAEEELKRSKEHLRNLALHLESLRENEKKHIAFEIHDELGHALTALKLELSWIIKKKHLRQEVMFEKVKKMSDLIDSTIRKVRSISSELRPSVLDHFGLVAAVEWQTAEFQKRSAVRCRMNIPQSEIKLDENRSIAVFRTLQEILTNVARHAQATRVDVNLEIIDDYLQLRVSDNGKGIKQEQMNNKKSFGLIGMYERASALGGKISISGVIGIGTTVTLQLPLNDKVI